MENFKKIKSPSPEIMDCFVHRLVPLTVMHSISTVKDGSLWNHISVSYPSRVPSWIELMKVKNEFLGEEVEAYQVLPKKSDHINIHKYCLHLWAPVDGERRVANLNDLINEKAPE